MLAIVSASRASSALLVASVAASTAMPAAHVAPTPVELARVDLTLIVSTHGEPVADLQPSDIEVLDNGVPQTIAALEYVDTLTGDSPEPPGDFAVVLDDLGTPRSGTGAAIAAGLGLVDALGPDDRLAIVNSGPFPLTRPLSTDRASARTTIRQFIGQRNAAPTTRAEACRRSVISLRVIENALEVMAHQPGHRRAMLVVGDDQRAFWGEARHERCSEARKLFDRIIAASSRANVAIYVVDVSGQQKPALPTQATTRSRAAGAVTAARRPSDAARGSLAMLAALTAGTVTAAPDGLTEGVHQMVRDTRQYYRAVYRQPEVSRGERDEFRHIHVRVRRPGVEVRARTRYAPQRTRDAR